MRAALASLVSARIGTQIAVLVVGALVLAHVAMAAAFLALHPVRPEQSSPFGAIERLALVVRMLDAEPDHGKRAMLLAQAQRVDNGLSVLKTAPPQEPAGARRPPTARLAGKDWSKDRAVSGAAG